MVGLHRLLATVVIEVVGHKLLGLKIIITTIMILNNDTVIISNN